MSLDMFFKNPDIELLVNWLTINQVRAIIGDLRAFDVGGDLILDELSEITGQVYNKIYPANTVILEPAILDENENIITPAVLDANAWVHLRLLNETELFDFSGDPDEDLDRWKHSKTVTVSSANAVESVVDGVTRWTKTAGPHSGVIIERGSEMQATGELFHEYFGGNIY